LTNQNQPIGGILALGLDGRTLDTGELTELKNGIEFDKRDLAEMKNLNPLQPNLLFDEKLTIISGEREIQISYLGIGNTIGDAVVYLPKEKVMITGDLVVYPSPYESGAFSPEWVRTSKKLKQFQIDVKAPVSEVWKKWTTIDGAQSFQAPECVWM
jgi:glyoxylase-like metal-dependent hydrolase (beta-lactamase superfamily II)